MYILQIKLAQRLLKMLEVAKVILTDRNALQEATKTICRLLQLAIMEILFNFSVGKLI